jgi:hypothetical protein|tara:strand:+ start:283 stop:684 length:402 start_codon:yes stop_codon:yes gene_type:complete
MSFFKINKLPEDMVGEIYSFIHIKSLSLTNKYYWKKHYKLKSNIKISSYYRYLLRDDYSYIFNNYLDIYFPFFIKNKKLIYQDKIFPRKIELLKYLSTFVFDSQKCKEIIDIYMEKNGLVFKRIKTRFNKWTN